MSSRRFTDNRESLVKIKIFLIDTFADKGIEDIGKGHYAGFERNVGFHEIFRIAGTIPLFVVEVCHVDGNLLEKRIIGIVEDFTNDDSTFGGMHFHYLIFFRFEFSRFVQDNVRYRDFSKIVERCCLDHAFRKFFRQLGVSVFFHEVRHKNLDYVAGVGNVTSSVVVTAFDNVCHADENVVLDLEKFFCLLFYFFFKFIFIVLNKFRIFLLLCGIGKVNDADGFPRSFLQFKILCADDPLIVFKVGCFVIETALPAFELSGNFRIDLIEFKFSYFRELVFCRVIGTKISSGFVKHDKTCCFCFGIEIG